MMKSVFSTENQTASQNAKFLYFDFETFVSDPGRLVPNLAVVQNDSGQEWIFPKSQESFGEDISEPLCKFLFQESHRDYFVIAHNFKVGLDWVVLAEFVGSFIQLRDFSMQARFSCFVFKLRSDDLIFAGV